MTRFRQYYLIFTLVVNFTCSWTGSIVAKLSTPSLSTPPFVAIFLNSTEHDRCISQFGSRLMPPESFICDHHTIAFNPQSFDPWRRYFGATSSLKVLSYGHDEHAQAILVDSLGPVVTNNTYPHITVAAATDGLYSAVYSNTLWARFVRDSPLRLKLGPNGLPTSVYLVNGQHEWKGVLPAFNASGTLYPQTRARLGYLNDGRRFVGTVCVSTLWNGATCKA